MKGNDEICRLSMPTRACSNACLSGLCELVISPLGVGLSSSGSVACGGRDRAGGCSQPSSKQNWQSCGCAAAPFPAWCGILAAWFCGTSAWFCHGCRSCSDVASGRHMSRGGEQFLPWLVQLRRSRTGTGFGEGSLYKSIPVLAEERFFLPVFLPIIPSWTVHEALNSAAAWL